MKITKRHLTLSAPDQRLRSLRLAVPLCVALGVLSLPALQGFAEDVEFTQAKVRFNSYKQQLSRLQASPQTRYLVGELTSLNQWIAQADRQLAEDEEERFRMLVDLIQVQIQLIDVSIEELIAGERVKAVEAEAADLEVRAKREREAIVNLEREMGGTLNAPPQQPKAAPPAQVTPSSATRPSAPAPVAPAPAPAAPAPAPAAPAPR